MNYHNNPIQYYCHIKKCIGTFLIVFLSWSTEALAALPLNQCEGNPVTEQLFQIDAELENGGSTGNTLDQDIQSGKTGNATCHCEEWGDYYSWFTATSNLPLGGDGWYQLNDYLDAKVSIWIYGPGFKQVPFTQIKNNGLTHCYNTTSEISGIATGSRIAVTFRLRKGIIGEVKFSGNLATLFWQLSPDKSPNKSYPFAYINADVTLHTTAQCSFREGDMFTVDLGRVYKTALVEGKKPKGFTPKSVDLSVDCINADTETAIDYTFQSASGSSGNFILTDLPGVGIGLLDNNEQPIGLGINNTVSAPFDNSSTSFFIKFYPTKLAGQEIINGTFTAQAIVTISLP